MNLDLGPLLSQVKLAWRWPGKDFMLSHPHALLITITSAPSKTQAINSMLATLVLTLSSFNICLRSIQLPYQAGWQDLKDLFRAAGNIIRADINIGADGRPKGSGTVVFETQKDAQQAISVLCCLFRLFRCQLHYRHVQRLRLVWSYT